MLSLHDALPILGNLYGPTSRQSREALALARRGWTVNPAADHAFVPYLWIDDASDALVRALDAPSGTYDVVEDGVLTAIDGRMALAAAVHRKRLRTVPRWMPRWAAGQEPIGRASCREGGCQAV